MLLWTLLHRYLFGSLLSIIFNTYLGSCPILHLVWCTGWPGTSISCFWRRSLLLFPFVLIMLFPIICTWGPGSVKFDEKEKKNQKVAILRAEIMNLFASYAKHEWLPLPLGQGAARKARKSFPHGSLSENHVGGGYCPNGLSWTQQSGCLFSY